MNLKIKGVMGKGRKGKRMEMAEKGRGGRIQGKEVVGGKDEKWKKG